MPRSPRPAKDPMSGPPTPQPPVSRQAVAAIVCAALVCCPFVTSFVAIILGVRAIRAIHASGGALVGLGLARTAVVIGTASIVVQFFALRQITDLLDHHLEREARRAVEATFASPEKAAAESWLYDGRRRRLANELMTLVSEAETRYGPFQSVSLTTPLEPASDNSYERIATLTLRFERASRIGGARFALRQGSGVFFIDLRLKRIVIEDPGGDDLSAPAPTHNPPDQSTDTSRGTAGDGV